MSKLKRLTMATLSASLLLTQGGPLPYLAYAVDSVNKDPINGEVKFSWTTADQVKLGSTFNPYEGLKVIDADGDNVAVLATVSGEVDTSQVGTYSISYSIENVDGETFTMTRQIEVVESEQDNDETITLPTDTQVDEVDQDVVNESDKDSTEETEKVETVPDEESGEDTSSHPLNDINWMLYDRSSKQELVQFKVNVETGKYEIYLADHLDESLTSLDDEALNEKLLELRIFSSQQVEKLNLSLTLNDLLTQSDEVKALMELPYELGDQIHVIPLIKEKNILVVNGVTGGDISIEQEDYSDGVESEDFIHNVRFVIDEAGLLTLYNEAPIIDGIQNIEVSDIESFNPKEGVTVKDDHDDNLLQHLTTAMEQLDEKTYQVTYQVTDSWGRTTEAVRQVVEVKELENQVNPLTGDDATPSTTLADNSITVKGIEFNEHGDERFQITFNPQNHKIMVVNQDGLTMNSKFKDTYFKLIHYSSTGEVKNSIELLGTDRSNSAKLNELKTTGWTYKDGDVIAIWHAEAETKLEINGSVLGAGDDNQVTEVSSEFLRFNRFELNSTGLKQITNTAPTIALDSDVDNTITIKRGESPNILQGLTISDDLDDFKSLNFEVAGFDVNTVSTQEIKITVTDSWGESTEYIRTLKVEPKNEIDAISVNVTNESGDTIFTLGFDELAKKFTITNQSSECINPNNSSEVLILRLYSNSGKLKRTIRIKGTDVGTSSVIEAMKKYTYSKGDYISITPIDPNYVSIVGNITALPTGIDYTKSPDLDYFNNVRFQLASDGTFKYEYNNAPVINGVDPITITRGEEFNPLDKVSVTDTEDVNISVDNITVKVPSDLTSTLGQKTITYSVTDSWGRTTIIEREVTVIAPNTKEYYSLSLVQDNSLFFSIGLDTITHKLKVTNYIKNSYFDGNESDDVFKLTVFDTNHEEVNSVSLKYNQAVDETFIKQVQDISFEDGYYITLWSANYENIIITYQEGENPVELNTFDSEDQMLHTRFEILDSGLHMIYNQAPQIIGADDVKVVYGNKFNPLDSVSAKDDEENLTVTVSGNDIDDQENFTATEIGTYQLTYKVTDSYGRTTEQVRTVEIVPVYTTNEVQYTDENNQYLISIGINELATGFTGTITDLSNSSTKSQDGIVTQDGNLDVPNETLFKFTVYDTAGKIVSVLEITELTIINEQLFDELKALTVRPGYRFSIEAKDLTKVKVTGRLEKDSQIESINYEDLKESNTDEVENVRFELTENIVKAIYNEAPVITIEPTPVNSEESGTVTLAEGSTNIIRNKAFTKEAYDLFEGVTVTDDKDQLILTVDNVEVDNQMLVSDLDESVATIGKTYTVTYHVEDSWGRESEPVERQVMIKSAMDEVTVDFKQLYNDEKSTDQSAMLMSFNMADKTITLTNNSTTITSASTYSGKFKRNNYEAFTFEIFDSNNNSLYYVICGGKQSLSPELDRGFNSNIVEEVINNFKEYFTQSLEYGMKLQFRSFQAPFLFINGNVENSQEDYTQGAAIGSILENSYFEVRPEGLIQIYDADSYTNIEGYSEMIWFDGHAGNQNTGIKLNTSNPDNLVLNAVDYGGDEAIATRVDKPLSLILYNQDGTIKLGRMYNGGDYTRTLINDFNNQGVEEGDYFVIQPKETLLANMKLFSLCNQYGFPTEVDYTSIITDKTYFDDVRFYVSKEGLVPIYNSAPVFTGVEDIDILQGTIFNPEEGVSVSDTIDEALGESLTYTTESTVDSNTIGTYTVTYTATDSWGRTTTVERTVNVRPTLFENKIQVFGANDTTNPAFEIVFDNQKQEQLLEDARTNSSILGGFSINRYSDDMLDISLATTDVFKLWVVDSNGNNKVTITLQGRDSANSDKLLELEEYMYEEGDIIKVWRHPGLNTEETQQIETLKITGTVINGTSSSTTDYSDGFENLDQMNNTIFKIQETGLVADYNEAPMIKGLENLVLYYGDNFDKLDGITVTDDKDTDIKLTDDNVTTDFQENRIGTYTATYTVTDSYGRTASKTIEIKVLSKVVKNTIEVYSSDAQKEFTIGFSEDAKRLILTRDANASGQKLSDDFAMNITIYDRFGVKVKDISITQDDTVDTVREKLDELLNISISNQDMIAISHTSANLIKIQGDVINKSHDYSQSLQEVAKMSEVRFKVTNSGLTEIKSDNYTIEISGEPLVIKRGEDYDLTEGVTVNHPTETILLSNIEVENFDICQIGEQVITYKVTDSWGKTVTKTREITVQEKNDLELVKISLMDSTGTDTKFTLGFDAVEMKLRADLPTQSIITRLFRTLPAEGIVFEVNVYDQVYDLLNSFTLTANDLTESSDIINKINQCEIDYGYFIEVRAYNYDDGLSFEGEISMVEDDNDETNYQDMDKKEFILNARFELTEVGLVAVYNHAPEFSEVDSEFVIPIGEEQDLRELLEISDDHDDLTYEDIELIAEDLDFYELGTYPVKFSLTDTWGRNKTVESQVRIVSLLKNNSLILNSSDSKEMMKLQFNVMENKYYVTFNEDNSETVGIDITLTMIKKDTQESSDKSYREIAIEIESTDTVSDLEQKFTIFNEGEYSYGSLLHIAIEDTEETNQIIINNLEVLSEDIPNHAYQETTAKDYFENVYFALDVYGLQAFYNHAPTVTNIDGDLTATKSLNVDDYSLLDSIKISDEDDYDKSLTEEKNIIIYYNKDKEGISNPQDPKNLELGENTITYVAVDTFGRQSEELTRNLTLTSGMDEVVIDLKQVYAGNRANDKSALEIHFDMDNKCLELINNAENADPYQNRFKRNLWTAYTFEILDSNNARLYWALYGGKTGFLNELEFPTDSNGNIEDSHVFAQVSAAITDLENNFTQDLEYGMKIRIQAFQAPFVFIDGPIVNAQEDYSIGAQVNEILNHSTFVITEEGLKQEYEPHVETNEKENIISWYAANEGVRQFELVVNMNNKNAEGNYYFEVRNLTDKREQFDTHNQSADVFSITLYSKDGEVKIEKKYKGGQYPEQIEADFDGEEFEVGDYLVFDVVERLRPNLRIFGCVDGSPIDYSQGVPDLEYYTESRFYITENGLSLDYNEAPQFEGIIDEVLYLNEGSLDLQEGITVTDDHDTNLEYKVVNETNITLDNYNTLEDIKDTPWQPSNTGAYLVNYIAKDSRNRITVEPRFIWVYARSQITVPDQSKLIIQEADPTLRTEDAVYQYLIDMVKVTDEEDDAANKPIQVTKDNIETNLNPMEPGTYHVTYTVTDSDNNESSATFEITVVRSINVSVPRNNIPFQVVTNLLGENTEGQEFISGTIKVVNNYVTDVNVSVKSLTVSTENDSLKRDGTFELVEPSSVDWTTLSEEDTMTKMALGLYAKEGIDSTSSITAPTKDSPIWLTTNMQKQAIGVLPKGTLPGTSTQADDTSTVITPTEAVLSFTAKYGKNFTSGKHRMQFTMVLEFE